MAGIPSDDGPAYPPEAEAAEHDGQAEEDRQFAPLHGPVAAAWLVGHQLGEWGGRGARGGRGRDPGGEGRRGGGLSPDGAGPTTSSQGGSGAGRGPRSPRGGGGASPPAGGYA